jgi:hypothetical protein
MFHKHGGVERPELGEEGGQVQLVGEIFLQEATKPKQTPTSE